MKTHAIEIMGTNYFQNNLSPIPINIIREKKQQNNIYYIN